MKITFSQWSANGDLPNKSIHLREIDIINYPKVIQSDENGYTLATEIKQIYSKWKFKGKTTMTQIIHPSNFVKADVNVFKGDTCIIRSEGELVPSMDKTKNEWRFDLELPNKEIKNTKLNKTSIENLTSGFGTNESADWLGKEIVADEIISYPTGKGINWKVKK